MAERETLGRKKKRPARPGPHRPLNPAKIGEFLGWNFVVPIRLSWFRLRSCAAIPTFAALPSLFTEDELSAGLPQLAARAGDRPQDATQIARGDVASLGCRFGSSAACGPQPELCNLLSAFYAADEDRMRVGSRKSRLTPTTKMHTFRAATASR